VAPGLKIEKKAALQFISTMDSLPPTPPNVVIRGDDYPIPALLLAPLPPSPPPTPPRTPTPSVFIGKSPTIDPFTLWIPPLVKTPIEFSKNNVIILDWDNTLCPSDWLMMMGFNVNTLFEYSLPLLKVIGDCERVAIAAERLIRAAQSYGQVVIVTNATGGWVNKTCSILMPGLHGLVKSLPVISACELYEPFYVNPNVWKIQTFRREVLETLFKNEPQAPRMVLSIGDGEAERNAVRMLIFVTNFGAVTTKSLKFMDRPTPNLLIEQMEKSIMAMPSMIASGDHMDLFMGTISSD
jgi:hypothetical protein